MTMNISSLVIAFLFSMLIFSCDQRSNSGENWEVVYRHNSNGETIEGDKQELINAVRRGYPIRIGFGGRRTRDTIKSVEHVTDAHFLTIANGTEVFVQITPIYGQTPNLEMDSLRIKMKHENKWTMLIGTNGERNVLSQSLNSEIQKASTQSKRGATWYAKVPEGLSLVDSKPLWD